MVRLTGLRIYRYISEKRCFIPLNSTFCSVRSLSRAPGTVVASESRLDGGAPASGTEAGAGAATARRRSQNAGLLADKSTTKPTAMKLQLLLNAWSVIKMFFQKKMKFIS